MVPPSSGSRFACAFVEFATVEEASFLCIALGGVDDPDITPGRIAAQPPSLNITQVCSLGRRACVRVWVSVHVAVEWGGRFGW